MSWSGRRLPSVGRLVWFMLLASAFVWPALGAGVGGAALDFPKPLPSYSEPANASLLQVLKLRVEADPFNLVATAIFILAILHTFMASKFMALSHKFEREHKAMLAEAPPAPSDKPQRERVSFKARTFHFLGEVEAIFGIWVVPLFLAVVFFKGYPAARDYLGHGLNFTEPLFVVVIMTIAASRPVLQFSENLLALAARLGKGSPAAWWLSILTFGPLLGSFITEPAAMTISALLLSEKFYRLGPSPRFAYATLGLLFVNVSVGGTLTHFAAPPVLMVAGKWGWGTSYMLTHFGWKAVAGILAGNTVYFLMFWKEFRRLAGAQGTSANAGGPATHRKLVPIGIIAVHLLFLIWTVLNNHFPALFIGGFLFYMAFTQATEHHQDDLALRPALLVGFFLAGLVIHGGLQGWWIAPVLSQLGPTSLFFSATGLTAFNDNAAITYLATLVPNFDEALKYAVVAGAVVGGGLTVIANAPNPAGQSILSRFFPDGISAVYLFLGALIPTILCGAMFLIR